MDTTQINYSKFDNFISQYDLYAFDFDLTILKIHAYAMDIKATQVESMSWKKLMDQFADPIFFRDLINYLIIENKAHPLSKQINLNKNIKEELLNQIVIDDKLARQLLMQDSIDSTGLSAIKIDINPNKFV